MILCDKTIRTLCTVQPAEHVRPQLYRTSCFSELQLRDHIRFNGVKEPMLSPFSEGVQRDGVISYGLTSAGYDLRLDTEILVFKNTHGITINPKLFKEEEYRSKIFDRYHAKPGAPVVIPPNSYILGQSYEHIHIPSFLKAQCVGKSTLARSGFLINTTPLEPGWKGHLTIEIANVTPCHAVVFCMEGIAQLEFHLLDDVPEKDYAAKGGKYQDQKNVTPAIVE